VQASDSEGADLLYVTYNQTTPSAVLPGSQIYASFDPVFLREADIDRCHTPRGLTHKLFANIGYSYDRVGAVPYLALGGEVEFGLGYLGTRNQQCSRHPNGALSQWGVWAAVGVSVN
jgi:hypothetical protein